LQKRFLGGDAGNISLLSWTRFLESNGALVGLRWKWTARCILRNLRACLPIAAFHDYKSILASFLIFVSFAQSFEIYFFSTLAWMYKLLDVWNIPVETTFHFSVSTKKAWMDKRL
jgi:hypothetical protein